MIVACHQLHYLPWLRYFHKLAAADVFVILDDAQFVKNEWHNRNKIKGPRGPIILTVPVVQKLGQRIADARIADDDRWRRKHLHSFQTHYGKAAYYDAHYPFLERLYSRRWERLAELSREIIDYVREALGIKGTVVLSSALDVEGKGTERLVRICQALGASSYLTGDYAAQTYLEPELFRRAGVDVALQRWKCPEYSQLYPQAGFIPDLSVIDLLLNEGGRSLEILFDGQDADKALSADAGR